MFYKLDKDKNVIASSFEEWKNFIQGGLRKNNMVIGEDEINKINISTIFPGIYIGCKCLNECNFDHPFFETLIFDKENRLCDIVTYNTYAEAETGHKKSIESIKNNFK